MRNVRFIRCNHCGNIFGVINDGGVMPICCGEAMSELVANSTDAAGEKHVPVIEREAGKITVKVGSVAHPMLEEHSIQWIALQQGSSMQRVELKPGEAPQATFLVEDGSPVVAYEYCNLHGLWKAEG